MSAAEISFRLADLCKAAASAALDAQIALGNSTDSGTVLLRDRLRRQVLSLTETATELRTQALLDATQVMSADLARMDAVIAQAEADIAAIRKANQLLTRIGQILAVGLAVVTLATQPGPGNAKALVEAIEALAA